MSKRHQVSRRRSYGRRQHELHEYMARRLAVGDPAFESIGTEAIRVWNQRPAASGLPWSQSQGVK